MEAIRSVGLRARGSGLEAVPIHYDPKPENNAGSCTTPCLSTPCPKTRPKSTVIWLCLEHILGVGGRGGNRIP